MNRRLKLACRQGKSKRETGIASSNTDPTSFSTLTASDKTYVT
jgi:hypothetical protein